MTLKINTCCSPYSRRQNRHGDKQTMKKTPANLQIPQLILWGQDAHFPPPNPAASSLTWDPVNASCWGPRGTSREHYLGFAMGGTAGPSGEDPAPPLCSTKASSKPEKDTEEHKSHSLSMQEHPTHMRMPFSLHPAWERAGTPLVVSWGEQQQDHAA